MPYVYFASYSRLNDNKYDRLGDVIAELDNRVRVLLGADRAHQVGFIDVDAIETGQQWQARISKAVHEARVLVCFVSQSYYNSRWCAAEFEVFQRRIRALPAGEQSAGFIIPVLWEKGARPRAISALQYDNDRFPPAYAAEGLASLKRVKCFRDAYKKTINQLAQDICQAAILSLSPLHPPVQLTDLPRAIHNPGPYGAAVAVIHDDGPQWSTGLPGWTIARSIERVAEAQRIMWEELPITPDLPERLSGAVAAQAVPLVIADAAAAKREPYKAIIGRLDAACPSHVAILVGVDDAAVDDGVARALFPRMVESGKSPFASFSIYDTNSLHEKLGRMIAKLRMARIEADTPARVTDSGLTAAAEQAGIPIATRPSLHGPSGATASQAGVAA